MRYLLLVYSAEPDPAGGLDAAGRELVARHRLEDGSTATSVRVRGDATIVADAPVEAAAGELRRVDVIDVPSLDEAIATAERIPAARQGAVEIRPVRRGGEAAA